MAEDTLSLLADCQLKVYKPNPRQYVASIPALPGLEVWFQRASDVVRKLVYGDVDLGIVGYDMLAEVAGDGSDSDLVILHDALGFGGCHLGLGIPVGGRFAQIDSLDALLSMPDWTPRTPLRVVTGYQNVARDFFAKKGFKHVRLLGADGALEAAPLMGTADIILDLVSTGVTLRENGLKQVEGGTVLQSQGVLVANRAALVASPALLDVVHELIERFEAHLKADAYFSVIANMRGSSPGDVASRILARPELGGLEGPTISPVYTSAWARANAPGGGGGGGSEPPPDLFAATVCVPKRRLYESVKALRAAGGSGVLVQPMTYIFDEEPARWRALLEELGMDGYVPGNGKAKEAAAAA
jgi:ATP phosphoribosyltransferase